MKKKILMFLYAICFIVPMALCLSACKDGNPEIPPVTYVVQFYNYDGSLIEEKTVEEGKVAQCPTATKADDQYYVYEFSNWEYLDGTDATSDLANVRKTTIVRAKFNAVQPTYTISYYDEDGVNLIDSVEVLRGENSTLPSENPTRVSDDYYDYTFAAWIDENGEEVQNITQISNNIDLYATWSATRHSFDVVIYDETMNTVIYNDKVAKDSYIDFKEFSGPSKNGFTHIGWTDNETGAFVLSKSTKMINKDSVFVATYSETVYELDGVLYELYDAGSNSYNNFRYDIVGSDEEKIPDQLTLVSKINGITVKSIKDQAFNGITKPITITIEPYIEYSGSSFYNCPYLTFNDDCWDETNKCLLRNIIIAPDIHTKAVIYAAAGATIPTDDSVGVIERGAITHEELTNIYIGKNIILIYEYAFLGVESIKSITIAEDNPNYKAEGNCIININKNYLLYANKYSTIPSYVESIAMQCFEDQVELESIVIPESVVCINSYAFYGCTSLKTVKIDSSTIANDLTSTFSCGGVVAHAEIIYIRTDINLTEATYILENFEKETSDQSGYDKYVIKHFE